MHSVRNETKNAIKFLDIPKSQLARMAGLEASRVSEYIRDKSLPTATTEKIESVVRDIVKVWTSLGIKTDLSDVEGFGRLLAHVNRCETEQLVSETVRFAALAGEGLNATCSVSEREDI